MGNMSRRVIDRLMAVGGIVILMVQVVLMALDHAAGGEPPTMAESRIRLAVVGIGLLMNQLGVWGILSLFVRRRRALRLRAEIDHFIDLVRDLHRNRAKGNEERAAKALEGMHTSVDRIAFLAGSEDDSPKAT